MTHKKNASQLLTDWHSGVARFMKLLMGWLRLQLSESPH